MRHTYESTKLRMDGHSKYAVKHSRRIEKYPHFKTEKEALRAAIKIVKEKKRDCQIWAKIENDNDGIFRFQNWWIVTDNNFVKQSADYIGMVQVYAGVSDIVYNNVDIDDLVVNRMI